MPAVATRRKFLIAMTRQQLLDLYFMDARHKLIDLAAFMDRVDRGEGEADYRYDAFKTALKELNRGDAQRAKAVLLNLSDPTTEPIPAAPGKGALGAWQG
jgi:hypothetical protein